MNKKGIETKTEYNIEEMIELFDVSYEEVKVTYSSEVYRLRKKTFSDRLGWDVVCNLDMEFDEFDNLNTRYIIGMYNGQLVCSVRFTRLEQPNMITHTFNACFETVPLPIDGIESSRFFVDKDRARQLHGGHYPLSRVLFLAMINWARHNEYNGIHTIVSRPMLTILKRSGWRVKTLKEAFLSERERIFLVFLPTEVQDRDQMVSGLISEFGNYGESAVTWPMSLPV